MNTRIPVLPSATPKSVPFPIGSRVYLLSCQFGEPGIVERTRRGRIEVRWPQLHFIGRYRPSRLMLAEQKQRKVEHNKVSGGKR